MIYELLVHLKDVVDATSCTTKVHGSWLNEFGVELLSFSNRGPGIKVTPELINSKTAFGHLDDEAGFSFRESRRRDALTLEFYFTNPMRAFLGDLNYISARFPECFVDRFGDRQMQAAIIAFTGSVLRLSGVVDAAFEHEQAAFSSPSFEVHKAVHAEHGIALGRLAFLNREFVAYVGGTQVIARAGLRVFDADLQGGCLVGLESLFGINPADAAWRMIDILWALEVLKQPTSTPPENLVRDRWDIRSIGAYLRVYEIAFGRTLSSESQTCLAPGFVLQ